MAWFIKMACFDERLANEISTVSKRAKIRALH